MILQTWKAGPSAGRTPSRASSPYSVSSFANGSDDRVVRRARGEAEQPLAARLAQIRDRVVGDVRVPDAAARERVARAAQRDRARGTRARSFVVPGRRARSHGIVRRASSPHSPFEAELVAGEDHRHARRRHLQADADDAAARASRSTVRKRGVSWLSSSVHELSAASHGTPARKARITRNGLGAAVRRRRAPPRRRPR